MLTFGHLWVLVLLPLPVLVRLLVPARVSSRPAVRVPFLSRLIAAKGNATSDSSHRRDLGMWSKSILWVLLVIAMARPQWLEPPIERIVPTRDLLLLVDLSASMSHEDFADESGAKVDRLTALKGVLGDFLLKRKGDRVGLVVFGNSPFLQVPFSTDLELTKQLLEDTAVGMAGPQTALGDAIGLGIQLFENSDAPAKTMIALTDGNDTSSAVPPTEAARVAADRGITIHSIAMGDPETVGEEKIDVEELRSMASATGGELFLALDRDQLEQAYETLDKIETREIKTVSHRPRRDLYHHVVAVAFVLSLVLEAGKLIPSRSAPAAAKDSMRLRVNPGTFELETTER